MRGERLFLLGTLSSLLLSFACQMVDGASPPGEKEVESWGAIFCGERLDTWICSLIGSVMVGLSGVLPLLIIPLESGAALKSEEGSHRMKQLLSFAIGGLLGNVFLHLLPEAWAYTCNTTAGGGQSFQQQKLLGLWVIIGLLTFLSLQKMFPDYEKQERFSLVTDSKAPAKGVPNGSSCYIQDGSSPVQRTKMGVAQCNGSSHPSSLPAKKIKISGYLNLLANTIDNFTHGLAVAAGFLVSRKVGFLTTMAILLHEIPHELGDFAILLRAGFDRWSAAKLQLSTALGGVLGACFAICAQSPKGTGETIAWILPFTSGGFLYIALVNVVPDLLEEKNPWNSVQQVLLLCTGITVMVLLSHTAD
ncbi:zinc transporter ZIP13 [Eublepharis macularius]|uniref:Zinc transporter ZIP13 n=1 Tax=Eublepharis macularius TaxID=481883 RepID=A0AA97IZF7_EUBMA|nr:zinc transporter ZIP13 [Eublepharis macularius]XP_054828316.1 zinc transporter ZIP13 [Eublepharis macularius]